MGLPNRQGAAAAAPAGPCKRISCSQEKKQQQGPACEQLGRQQQQQAHAAARTQLQQHKQALA